MSRTPTPGGYLQAHGAELRQTREWVLVEVVERWPSAWRGWLVERWACGHGALVGHGYSSGGRPARRRCRLCESLGQRRAA